VSTTVTALEDAYTDADLFETISQIRANELDDAGTHELVHHIRGKATPEKEALGSFARRKLKPPPIWDVWLASEWLRTARLSSEVENLWRTLPCPTWCHGVAFPLELYH
jgi:hypothetical protein